MATKIYLALYKGRAKNWRERLEDWLIRAVTKGQYSHCELAVKQANVEGHYHYTEWFECYSSSPRDGGVRCKVINVADSDKWDLIALPNVTETQIKAYFEQTKGERYDLLGALGVVLRNAHSNNRYFCSEWCGNVMGIHESWRFSPNDLAAIFKK